MMVLLTIALSCPSTILIDWTDTGFNAHDKKIVEMAKKTCKNEYKESPCLVKFLKKGFQNYWACCSTPDSKGDNCGF